MLLPPGVRGEARPAQIASAGQRGVDTLFTKDTEITIDVVKIPVSAILAPLQQPLRWLFGVRVIEGQLIGDDAGYAVLVSSSSGQTWADGDSALRPRAAEAG